MPQTGPAQVRAVRLDGPALPPRAESLPAPQPGPNDAVLRVLAAGVCHTDLQLLDGTLNPGVWPLTPGHEIVGEVVDGSPPWRGQRALVYYSRPCGECDWCRRGQAQVCPNAGPQVGLSTDGGFAEYVRVPADSLVPLPEDLDPLAAAPLGCAAATAYHALHAVAKVRPGESVVVYGVGGVGLALVQLGVTAGARVLAVGRSPAKLALAEAFGAEPIDGLHADAVLQVRRLTRGEGVHVAFDLVGDADTLANGMSMLRRQGRLVCVGYGAARLQLNPLELVLRETHILGAVGNTRAELETVVRLAASGALRVPVGDRYALEDVDLALAALRAGTIVGRAVIVPGYAPRPRGSAGGYPLARAAATSHRAEHDAAAAEITFSRAAPPPARTPSPAARGDDPSDVSAAARPFEAELLAFVARGLDAAPQDAEFNDVALRLFAYQFANNRPYRLLAERRGRTPATLRHWRDLPTVPIAAFKETLLAAEPTDAATEFNSSGTTDPERKSRHFHPNLELYNLNATLNFKAHVLPDRSGMRMLVLFPRRSELPHSSLAHWLTLMVERFGQPGSGWFVSNADGLDAPGLLAALRQAAAAGEPVTVLGASFGVVHFLEYCQARGERVALPAGSRLMDTGGYKGRSREYAPDALYGMVADILGVPPTHTINMYGLTEHGTQFLDSVLRFPRADGARYKVVPPWARTLVVDPQTLQEVPRGERGLLLHVDLINRASAVAVLSEDVGRQKDHGFELLGRAQGTEARGCSIALDELIEAVRDGGRG